MRNTTLYLLLFVYPFLSYSQNCFNAGLEDGTLKGYTTYYGNIDKDGKVTIDQLGERPKQHRIMHIEEGIDPIAEKYCTINQHLPVVPEGGGQYTLRLGNSNTGGKAERVVLEFTVTPELTFFLLRYAVLINDPKHDPHEQPRFELRILDQQGKVFPCGEYNVRAAADIPGFESCSSGWRVRPWTTVGFELQSFLGQTIQIELLTTDCAQGGHAGYAYLDASCQPLKINLEGYCPENSEATMRVTDGFIDYQWNTGANTSAININNPQAGESYQVTVTSATGCTMVLKDTIPDLRTLPAPKFYAESDKTFCRDTTYWFTPNGKNLGKIYSPTLGTTDDAFLIGTKKATHYTFLSSDEYGCNTDTLTFNIHKAPLSIGATIDSLSCFGDTDGGIQLSVASDFPPIHYQWEHGPSNATLQQLVVGNYTVTIVDALQCTSTATYILRTPPPLSLSTMEMHPISCYGEADGELTIHPEGGKLPYDIVWNAAERNTMSMSELSAGTYIVTVTDANNCTVQNSATLKEPPPLLISSHAIPASCYGNDDGEIGLSIEGGLAPYQIYWQDNLQQVHAIRNNLSAGTYQVTITDDLGCTQESQILLSEPPFNQDCGTYIPTAFSPNGDGINDYFLVAGSKKGIAIKSMQIFNRWGAMVFENKGQCAVIGDALCGWSGRINGQLAPNGLYVYLIVLQIEGIVEPVLYTGEVALVK